MMDILERLQNQQTSLGTLWPQPNLHEEAADEITRLREENERLQGLLREAHVKMEANNLWSNLRHRVAAAIREGGGGRGMTAEEFAAMERRARMFEAANEKMLADNKRLREENARLREVLQPFAELAESRDVSGFGDVELFIDTADLRAAAAAIREGGKSE